MIAITRGVSPSVAQCELTHIDRQPIDFGRAAAQHEAYRRTLDELGCTMIEIDAADEHPDCVFIEDTAVIFDDLAVITRPGAASRRNETEAVAAVLAEHRLLARIDEPATVDGGDVLVLGDRIYVGLSSRTSGNALEQLAALTGRRVTGVELRDCLHLKTAATRVSDDTLLVNPAWVTPAVFEGWRSIEVDPDEPFGANALVAGGTVVYPEAFPRTRHRMEAIGLRVVTVDASELAKAEGGVTCCSLLLD